MRFKKGQAYKVVEMEGALVVLADTTTRVQGKSQQPLIVADAGPLLTYLDRYFFERENGRTLKEAHELAMKTANISRMIVHPPAAKKES